MGKVNFEAVIIYTIYNDMYNGKDGWNSWKTQCYMSFEHSLSVILEFLYALSDITQGPKKKDNSVKFETL